MTDFLIRLAVGSDAFKIRDLIHRVGINPTGLNWQRFMVAKSPEGVFMGWAQLKPHRDAYAILCNYYFFNKLMPDLFR